jgi:hypothetical protein
MANRNISNIQIITNYFIRKARGAFQTFDEVDSMLHFGQQTLYEIYWQEYLSSGVLPQALEAFKTRFTFTLATSVGGLVAKPADYGKFLNGYTINYNNTTQVSKRGKLVPINEDEVVDAVNSQLRPVSVEKPLILQGGSNFVLYPQQPMAGEINYLKMPVAPVFGYTQVGRVITYVPSTSTQLLWADNYINLVILQALSSIGINLNEQQITEYSESKAKQTEA